MQPEHSVRTLCSSPYQCTPCRIEASYWLLVDTLTQQQPLVSTLASLRPPVTVGRRIASYRHLMYYRAGTLPDLALEMLQHTHHVARSTGLVQV